MSAGFIRDFGLSSTTTNQVELQIVYLEEQATPSSYVMPDVISVEVRFGVDIPPKLIQAATQ